MDPSREDELRAAIALLPSEECANRVRRLSYGLDEEFGTGYAAGALPPHVSLKQPFEVRGLGAVEALFNAMAASLDPFSVVLDRSVLWQNGESGQGTVALSVEDPTRLRELHRRLNEDLPDALGHPTPAAFDGDGYQPHLTVAFAVPPESFAMLKESRLYERLGWPCPLETLALFVYRRGGGTWRWTTYKTAALH